MSNLFTASEGELAVHWNVLTKQLTEASSVRTQNTSLKSSAVGENLVAAFFGAGTQRIQRLRGDTTSAIVFKKMRDDWEALLGYREVWQLVTTDLRLTRRYAFSSADITIFFSSVAGDVQQILRAEWAGPEVRADGISYKPHDAGHPHWQFDLGETIKSDTNFAAARDLLAAPVAMDFGSVAPAAVQDPPWYRIGKMHLASAMRPWVDDKLAHGPQALVSVRAWVVKTTILLHTELDRL